MTGTTPVVHLVDDDPSVRRGVGRLLQVRGYTVETWDDPRAFLAAVPADPIGCVILDLNMPGMDGLQTQLKLAALAATLPVVFLSGRGTIASCAEALKQGAVDFLEKPADSDVLSTAVEKAFARNRDLRAAAALRAEADELVGRLTERERDVFRLVARGFTNSETADLLDISAETVKVHRSRVMKKLEADSLPDLVLLAVQSGLA